MRRLVARHACHGLYPAREPVARPVCHQLHRVVGGLFLQEDMIGQQRGRIGEHRTPPVDGRTRMERKRGGFVESYIPDGHIQS
jgi:hypothetical protein